MKIIEIRPRYRRLLMAMTLCLLAAGCGQDQIFGSDGTAGLVPVVIAETPAAGAAGVLVTTAAISATLNEAVSPITGTASFTLTCAAPCADATGTVSLDATHTIASFTLTPGTALAPFTLYTATLSGAMSLASGLAMAAPFVWQFTTVAAVADLTRPRVLSTNPLTTTPGPTPGVPATTAVISATLNEAVSPITGTASFTLTCAAPCADATGTVSLDATHTIASFTLTPGTTLAPSTIYTATLSGAMSLASGIAMAAPYVWQFTTVAAPADLTRPRVLSTNPLTTTPGPTPGVPGNSSIAAIFSKDLAPATVSGTSFTVTCTTPCVSPAGSVSYSVSSRTAVFTPASALTAGDTYTVRLTTAITDIAGNALAGNQAALPAASDYVWTFTAAAVTAAGNVSVLSTNPAANATTVCPTSAINATFMVPSGLRMDPTTVTPATFIVTGPAPAYTPVAAASVSLDPATGHIATFTTQAPLTAGVTYTATIDGGPNGVKDLAVPADKMLANFTWSFTVGPSCSAPVTVPLASAAPFGTFGGGAGMTNSGILTVVNGDIGTTAVSTAVTGFHDTSPGCTYTEVAGADIGTVNGLIYTSPPPPTVACPDEGTTATAAIATQASADALKAYNALVAKPAGPDPGAGNLANLTLVPGTYTAAAGSFEIVGGNLTLDAGGDANAVWVFQMATSLTVGGPGAPESVILVNGAQAKNVFWQVGSAATINGAGGGTMVGTIISSAGATVSTFGNVAIVTINGRVLSLNASVTLVDTVINVPAP